MALFEDKAKMFLNLSDKVKKREAPKIETKEKVLISVTFHRQRFIEFFQHKQQKNQSIK